MQGLKVNMKNCWHRLAHAINHYERSGFEYIEVPWLVSKESLDVTRPPYAKPFETFMGNLVASGEQSFIEIREDLCPRCKYQCITPCFRDENYDELHFPYFIKNELIVVLWKDDKPMEMIEHVISTAQQFFKDYLTHPLIMPTEIGWDIVYIKDDTEIELGSYGYREYDGFRWVYGTGCAEPRLSQAISIGMDG